MGAGRSAFVGRKAPRDEGVASARDTGNRRCMTSTIGPWAPLLASFFVLSAAGCGGPGETTQGGGGSTTTAAGGTGGTGTGGMTGGGGATGGAAAKPQDILTTDLALDLGKLTGTAKIEVQPATDATAVS